MTLVDQAWCIEHISVVGADSSESGQKASTEQKSISRMKNIVGNTCAEDLAKSAEASSYRNIDALQFIKYTNCSWIRLLRQSL